MQCFDGGTYDRRYRETFAPAIERGGAKPVRADEVLGTIPVIEKIERGLQSADIAFAEISENNSNVFLELGYALCLSIPTVIVCDKSKRARLPFDIAHRTVIFYTTDSQSDWEEVSRQIESGIAAALLESKSQESRAIRPEGQQTGSMDDIKHACMMELLDRDLRSPEGSTLWELQRSVAKDGINDRMVGLAIASLKSEGFVDSADRVDHNADEKYVTYRLTDNGNSYLLRSYSNLIAEERQRLTASNSTKPNSFPDDLDDNVPF